MVRGATACRIELGSSAAPAEHSLAPGLVRACAAVLGVAEPAPNGQTRDAEPTSDFERPPVPGQEHAPAVVSRAVAALVFSTGDVVEVDRTVLVGRDPEARQFASHDQPRTVAVSSPQQEISSTHLEIRPGAGADHGMAIVTDLGLTNGTVLVQPGLSPEDLQAGSAVSLIPGVVLDLADGDTIQITNPRPHCPEATTPP